MNKNDVLGLTYIFALLVAIFGFGYGYVMNIYNVWIAIDVPITGKFILRIIGIFLAPLGVILGYF